MPGSSIEDIKEELIHNYRNEKNKNPRLVLSIIGDSDSFVPKPWLTQVFQLGLTETAKGAKDCLILYKGSEEKVSCLVREAVNNIEVLDKNDKKSKANKATISLVGIGPTEKKRKEHGKCFTLDDNGYVELLSKMSKEYVPFVELGKDNKLKMPVLVIVAEGGIDTIELIKQVLESSIPILVLKGSGKAADLIAGYLNGEHTIEEAAPLLFGIYFNNNKFKSLNSHMNEIQKNKQLVNILDINKHDESHFPDAVSNAIIRAWAQEERPITSSISRQSPEKTSPENEKCIESDRGKRSPDTLNAGANKSIDNPNGRSGNSVYPSSVTLHNAVVEGDVKRFMGAYQKSLSPASLPLYFYIAFQFIQEMTNCKDKCQVAIQTHLMERNVLFFKGFIYGSRKFTEVQPMFNFQILLKQALVADRVDYVTVLLQEKHVKFNREHFPYIYDEVLKCECIDNKNTGDCQHMWAILKSASSDSSDKLFKSKDYQDRMKAGRQLCQTFLHYPRNSCTSCLRRNNRELYHDLLIWAIFCNRKELATLFWSKCPNQLETAVLACCILKRMASKAKSGKDQFLYTSFQEHSAVFAQRSLELQSIIYGEDPEVAMDMIMTECTVLDIQVSPLECAKDNVMLDFIAHSCSQRQLNKIWYKQIGSTLSDFWWNGLICGQKMKFFQAPLTRFLVHYFIFIAALMCYSAFLLIELSDYKDLKSIKIYEWLIYIWLFGDIVEEYRGLMPWNNEKPKNRFTRTGTEDRSSQAKWYRLKKYLNDFWNALDVFSYLITIAAILVRFLSKGPYGSSGTGSYNYADDPKIARRLYSLSLFTMYMRFLHALLMSRKLGPKIIMIKEMLKELFRFIGILFVFMVGVGVLYHANMYPAHYDMWNANDWTYWRIWKIMYIPYWQIYGELFLEEFNANSSTPCTTDQSIWESNPDIERCNEYDWVLIVIAALYLLISNLLLVNLVIALFSYRFEIVQANSEKLWRFWRYAVIMDYRTRVPAPLNLLIRPFMFMFKCIQRCNDKKTVKETEEEEEKNARIDKRELKRMKILQDISAYKCIRLSEKIT